MAKANDFLAVIQAIYTDALLNEPHDLAQASTPALVAAVQANVASARTAYFAAVAAAFKAAPGVELAYASAEEALKAVKSARTESESIGTLLGKLNAATIAGTRILSVVGKWPPIP